MNNNTLFRFFFSAILAITLPCLAFAATSPALISTLPLNNEGIIDTNIRKQPVKSDDKKQDAPKEDDKKQDIKRPDIKEVPKAKRQLKPAALKGKVKIPVKKVKPIIKRPIGLVRRNLGI